MHKTKKQLIFRRGRSIKSLDAILRHGNSGGWFYMGRSGRPKHHGFILSMPFRTVAMFAHAGRLQVAVRNKT